MKIPVALVDQVLDFARQLDGGQLPPGMAAVPDKGEALERLRAENRELRDRLAAALAEQDRLAGELAALRPSTEQDDSPPAEPPPDIDSSPDGPPWLDDVRKRVMAIPKPTTRLMVISLILGHQAYTEERLRDQERRSLEASASARRREEWQARQLGLHRRLLQLDRLFAALPQDLVAEARGLQVNWGTRAANGAKRSYEALLKRMGRT